MLTKVSEFYSSLAVGLLIWGGLCMVWSGDTLQEGDALIVENRDQDLGEQTVGIHTLELLVRNTSSQRRRILGMTGH